MEEHPAYPLADFLSDFEACNFSVPATVGYKEGELAKWFTDFLLDIYPDGQKAYYRGGRLIAAYGHIRAFANFYSSEGLGRKTSSGGFIASTELLSTLYDLIGGPEEKEGMPDKRDIANLAKMRRSL